MYNYVKVTLRLTCCVVMRLYPSSSGNPNSFQRSQVDWWGPSGDDLTITCDPRLCFWPNGADQNTFEGDTYSFWQNLWITKSIQVIKPKFNIN